MEILDSHFRKLSPIAQECVRYILENRGPDADGFAHPDSKPAPGEKNGKRRITLSVLEEALTAARLAGLSREVLPIHFQSIHGLLSEPNNVSEAIARKYRSLNAGKTPSPGRVVELSTVKNLSTNFQERIAGKTRQVTFNSVFRNVFQSNPRAIAVAELTRRGELDFLMGLKDYFFPTPPNGTYEKKSIDEQGLEWREIQAAAYEVVDGQIRHLLKTRFTSLADLIRNISSKDFGSYESKWQGHSFSVSSAYPLTLIGGVFQAVKTHLWYEGLEEEYRDLKPIHLARASAESLSREIAEEMLIGSAARCLREDERFEGCLAKLCERARVKEDLLRPYSDSIAGEEFPVRPQKAFLKFIKTRAEAIHVLRSAEDLSVWKNHR